MKAVVLLSAGLDSTYNLFVAQQTLEVALVLTFDYGQRAAAREVACAREMARGLGLRHLVVELPWFADFSVSALNALRTPLPLGDNIDIADLEASRRTAKSVWVPNRNGILLNVAAGFAEGLGAQVVVPGFNAEEAATFPDNTQDFLERLTSAWALSTATQVRAQCFSTEMDKTQIVAESIRLNVPFTKLWPCYQGQEVWCGECESCQRFDRALAANGLSFAALQGST